MRGQVDSFEEHKNYDHILAQEEPERFSKSRKLLWKISQSLINYNFTLNIKFPRICGIRRSIGVPPTPLIPPNGTGLV